MADNKDEYRTTVAFFPNSRIWNLNQYYPQLQSALTGAGCQISPTDSDFLDFSWLYKNRKKIQVLHLHWIQYHYSYSRSSILPLGKFIIKLIFIRLFGYKLIWTFHNVMPHEKLPGQSDLLARYAIIHLAHRIIVHCEKSKDTLRKKFHRSHHVYYVPHGTYPVKDYSNSEKQAARTSLGIKEEQVVFSHIGNIRPYKNIDKLIKQFLKVAKANWLLIIKGKANSPEVEQELCDLCKDDPRVILNFEFIEEAQLLSLLQATDISVFAFKNILCSGSAIESMSAGLPVIAPAIGCLQEWITDDLGMLYDPEEINTLGDAMLKMTGKDLLKLGSNAKKFVHNWKWQDIGSMTKAVYLS